MGTAHAALFGGTFQVHMNRKGVAEPAIQQEKAPVLAEIPAFIHDFNTVLTIITGKIELLLKRVNHPATREELQTVWEAAWRGAETVRHLQRSATAERKEEFVWRASKSPTPPARDEAPQPGAKAGRPARILVIEDEIRLLDMLAEILARDGHTVWKASDGEEGLAIFERETIDVVFTDLSIPKVSGWEVARAVKRKDPRVPIILVTGSIDQVDSRRLAENGVDLVVPKPFYMEDISSALTGALGLRPVGRESDPPPL